MASKMWKTQTSMTSRRNFDGWELRLEGLRKGFFGRRRLEVAGEDSKWQAKTRSGRRRLEVAGEGSKFGGGVDPAASTRLMSDWPMTST